MGELARLAERKRKDANIEINTKFRAWIDHPRSQSDKAGKLVDIKVTNVEQNALDSR